MVSLHLHVFTQPRAIADISLEAVISREASLVTGAGVMAAGDRDPMRLPVIPASATAMRQIHSTSAPTFETLVIQNAVRPPVRGYPAFCVLKMER